MSRDRHENPDSNQHTRPSGRVLQPVFLAAALLIGGAAYALAEDSLRLHGLLDPRVTRAQGISVSPGGPPIPELTPTRVLRAADVGSPSPTPALSPEATGTPAPSVTPVGTISTVTVSTTSTAVASLTASVVASVTVSPGATGTPAPSTPPVVLRSEAATFDSATCQNVDNSLLVGTPNADGTCHIAFSAGGTDGFPLPFVSNGLLGNFELMADGSGSMEVTPGSGYFFVLITSQGGRSTVGPQHTRPQSQGPTQSPRRR